jgi:spermidine synthase
VKAKIGDVARVIADAPPERYDAIVLDLYEGPHHATAGARDPLYGVEALERAWSRLRPGGVLAVWSEEADRPFESRLASVGFRVTRQQGGGGGRAHVVYLGARVG